MVRGDGYCFIHIPKCAGNHISALLERYFGGRVVPGRMHAGIGEPEAGVRYVTSIRNPFSFYVSLWASWICLLQSDIPRPFLHRMFPDKLNLLTNHLNIVDFREWLAIVLNKAPGYLRGGMPGYRQCPHNIGLLTFRYFNMLQSRRFEHLAAPSVDVVVRDIVRAEHLEDDLLGIMGELGYDLSDEVRLAIRRERRRNRSKHLPYEQYYDAESIALVEEKECYLMRKFGYTFIDSA